MKSASLPPAAALFISFAICFATAALGAAATAPNMAWQDSLAKPAWSPPNWVFGPVWTLLYAMMAVAGWLIWMRVATGAARIALALFAVQLVLNGAWSWIFFGFHQIGWALAEIALLWLAILGVVLTAWKVSRPASLLMLPYLLWVSFAAALNFAIWRLN